MITVLPGEAIRFEISPPGWGVVTPPEERFTTDVFAVDLQTFEAVWALARIGEPGDDQELDALATHVALPAHPIRHASQTIRDETNRLLVAMDPLATGLYVMRLAKNRHTVLIPLNVTTIGVITARGSTDDVEFAINLRTFCKRHDVTFERSGDDHVSVRTNDDGLAVLTTSPWTIAIAHAPDGSLAFTNEDEWYAKQHGQPEYDVVQTDRELYRAGDLVHYRVVERKGYADGLVVPTGTVNVRVFADQSTEVQSQDQPLSAYGTASGTYAIPPVAPTGLYIIAVNGGHDISLPEATQRSGEFYVAAYTVPRHLLTVSTPHTFAIAEDGVRFAIVASGANGTPAAGLRLRYRAMAGSHASGEVLTGTDGTASLTLKADDPTASEIVLDVRTEDDAHAQVSASARVRLFKSKLQSIQFQISRLHEYATVNQNFPLVIEATDQEGVPVAHLAMDLSFTSDQTNRVADVKLTTDEFGRATYLWRPIELGRTEIEATATDGPDSKTQNLADQTVSDASQFNEGLALNLETSKSVYSPGEPARIFVTADRGDVDALVCVSTGLKDRLSVVHLGKFDTSLVVSPPSGVAAYGVTIWVPSERGIFANSIVVHVAPSARRGLQIGLAQDMSQNSPAADQRLNIGVHDDAGSPADAEVGLSVAYETPLRPASESSIDLLDVFDSGVFSRGGAASWSRITGTTVLFETSYPRGIRHLEGPTTGGINPGPIWPTFEPDVIQVSDLKHAVAATKFWSPSLVTDARGSVTATLHGLSPGTQYRASALAVGLNGEVAFTSSAIGGDGLRTKGNP